MNLWNVAYVNNSLGQDPPELVFLHQEPMRNRAYSCLVKWKATEADISRLTIEEVRFSPEPGIDLNKMVWVRYGSQWLPRGETIDFAVSDQQVIRHGKIVPVHTINHQFSDFRLLVQMPNLNPVQRLYPGDSGRPRQYFGELQHDDIWLGEADFLADENLERAALSGPVFLDFRPSGANERLLRGALQREGYREVQSALQLLAPGQWRLVPRDPQTTLLEIYFKRNTYACTMIGLSANNRHILALACTGRAGANGFGYILEEATELLLRAGAHNALSIDAGNDVFQKVQDGDGCLREVVPPRRCRLRATFVFARLHS